MVCSFLKDRNGLQDRAKLEKELDSVLSDEEAVRLLHQLQNDISMLQTKIALLEQELKTDEVAPSQRCSPFCSCFRLEAHKSASIRILSRSIACKLLVP